MNSFRLANDQLQGFAYAASHDLREPLKVMAGFGKLLAEKSEKTLDPQSQEYLSFILDASQRMNVLIEDLLEYVKLNQEHPEREEVCLEEVLAHVISNLRFKIEKAGAKISMDIMPRVRSYTAHMVLLFQNLIDNAIKFGNPDDPRIHIGVHEDDNDYTIWVKDNGIGIDTRFHDRIFGVFKRLNKKRDYEGTGIGLAICKKIVLYQGGDMWVESQIDQGSTFFIKIPKYPQEYDAMEAIRALPVP